jgi:hypothetical protein
VISEWFYGLDMSMLCLMTIILVVGAVDLGNRAGLRHRATDDRNVDVSTLAGASLGLLALLGAFSFSMAESRYDQRRSMVLEEANAIGSTANFALMLPHAQREPILSLLRDYTTIRIVLGVPYDPIKTAQDIAWAPDFQARLWQRAVAVTASDPQSLPVYRFVASLNEMNNIHERRLTGLRNHVPVPVTFILIGTAVVAMGLAVYNAGVTGAKRHIANLVMSVTIVLLIMLVVDLDRPYRGLIQALVDAAASIPY